MWSEPLEIRTIVLLFGFLFPAITSADDSGGGIAADLAFDESSYSVLQPVTARLELRNESDQAIRFVLGNIIDVEIGDFPVSRPDGGGAVLKGTVLEPGESTSQRLLLDDWHGFEEPGNYPVRVVLDLPPLRAEATCIISITPRDPERLRAACERLASWAVSYDAETALIAGKAFKYISDEVCLDSLARVLRESFHVKEGAMIGLVRAGSVPAFHFLAEAWDNLRRDQQVFAVSLAARYEKGEALQTALLAAGKSNKPFDPKDVWNIRIPSWAFE